MVGTTRFFGWSVAWSAFTIAVFAWGIGFYGPFRVSSIAARIAGLAHLADFNGYYRPLLAKRDRYSLLARDPSPIGIAKTTFLEHRRGSQKKSRAKATSQFRLDNFGNYRGQDGERHPFTVFPAAGVNPSLLETFPESF